MKLTNEQVLGEQVSVDHVTKVFSQILHGSDVFALYPAGLQRVPPFALHLHTSGDSPTLTCTADSSPYPEPAHLGSHFPWDVHARPERDIRGPAEPGPSISY